MLINLLSLALLFALGVGGVVIIVRALLEPMPGGSPACARCGSGARNLTDFLCPHCGHDVREAGLFAAPLDSAFARFWRAVAVTAMVITAWGFSDQLMYRAAGTQMATIATADLQPNKAGSSIESIQMTFNGIVPRDDTARGARSGGGPLAAVAPEQGQQNRGELIADLSLSDGRMMTLEVELPDRDARAIDENGRVTPYEQFDEQTMRTWLASCGVDLSTDYTRFTAAALYHTIDEMTRGDPSRAAHFGGERAFFSGSRGRSSSSFVPEPERAITLLPTLAWPAIWVVALHFFLRRRGMRQRHVGEIGAAATGRSGSREEAAAT